MTAFKWITYGVVDGQASILMPEHMPIPVDVNGQGPVLEDDAHAWICWCGAEECLLTKALAAAWVAGYAHGYGVGRSTLS